MPEAHLNQIELARRWRLSHRTLERWRWTGEGPPYLKLGGRVVYRLDDVAAFETERLLKAPQTAPARAAIRLRVSGAEK